jgi:oxazoline/thiazoline synthase
VTPTVPATPRGAVPRFRRHLRVESTDDTVFVFDEHGVSALSGAPVVDLAPWLDGSHDMAALEAARPGGLTAGQVRGLVGELEAAGLVGVEETPPVAPAPMLAWWDACGLGAESARTGGRVGLQVLAEHGDPAPLRAALTQAGLEAPVAVPADLDVVLCADYLDPRLAEVDRTHRASGTPWLPARIDGVRAWIGPVFGAPGTGCWHCLAHRLRAHRRAEAAAQRALGRDGPATRAASAAPPAVGAMAHIAALEASKWVAGLRYDGQRCVWSFDTTDLRGRTHELRPRPQCPSCGDPELVGNAMREPVALHPAPKVEGLTGDRTRSADETLERHQHLISPVTGILKEVTPDPLVPAFAHAFRSGANLAHGEIGLAALRKGLRAENGGKGLTARDAEVGALCEAAERFSGCWQGDEPRVRASFASLDGEAVDPRRCLLVDPRQYATRAQWNPVHSPFNHVPEPFDPDAPIDWTPLWSLTDGRRRLLPSAMLFFGGPRLTSMHADSNGCAAGSSREDAILQGALELVERDAVAQWWYNRLLVPGVDLDTAGDPRLAEHVRHHAGIGRELWALDLTSDLGVPTVAAVSRRVDGPTEHVLLGFGAHLDPVTAARRAVAEVNQMLHADHAVPSDPDWAVWARESLADHPHLVPAPGRELRPTAGPASGAARRADVRDDVEDLVARFAARGMETLVLDQTRPDVGIPVVRVVVPGMRSFWARFAPGRLFDAPVADGRLDAPTAYGDLNPLPLFL